ncbi:hypothetical protein HZS_2453 [Henneguya salminicola]|nr:hypothetical protein HZS_2453 [Henneguya salminicola]
MHNYADIFELNIQSSKRYGNLNGRVLAVCNTVTTTSEKLSNCRLPLILSGTLKSKAFFLPEPRSFMV